MTALTSELTKTQNDLLGAFIGALKNYRTSCIELANRYKECIDNGMEMIGFLDRNNVSKGLQFKLQEYAKGNLAESALDYLMYAPDKVSIIISNLSLDKQQEIVEKGVEVYRDGKAQIVKLSDIMASEASVLVDPISKRLLSAEEQKERLKPKEPRHDERITIILTRKEVKELKELARKKGKSLPLYIKSLMYEKGVLSTDK